MYKEIVWCMVLALLFESTSPYPIYQFILNDAPSGVLLEFSRLEDNTQYDAIKNSSAPVTVVMLSANPKQDFAVLREAQAALHSEADFIFDKRDRSKLSTAQLHVIVRNSNSIRMPGTVKFMIPLRKMNSSSIVTFLNTAVAVERQIISPNIHKILCIADQQVVLMNSALGAFKAFTMYITNDYREGGPASASALNSTSTDSGCLDLEPSIAKQVLNPIRCELMYGASLFELTSK